MIVDFAERLKAQPEYQIQGFVISRNEIMLLVAEYNDAQLEISEFAYGRKITIIKLLPNI